MTRFDFSPLYRSAIGFDRLFELLDSANRSEAGGYPPYNIELTGEDEYRITMAVAGFSEDDLDLTTDRNVLTVSGKRDDAESDGERNFVHRGIAERAFERRFQLADYVEVVDATLKNGLLHIDLRRELPEAMKPRKIAIGGKTKKGKLLEGRSKAA